MLDEGGLLRFIKDSLLAEKGVRIGPETPLFEEKLLNSMNILDLIGYLERGLGRRLTEDEIVMSNFRSVRAMSEAFFRDGDG